MNFNFSDWIELSSSRISIENTPLNQLIASTDNMQDFLFELEQDLKLSLAVTPPQLYSMIDDYSEQACASPFYWLCRHQLGIAILSLLFQHHPALLLAMKAADLCQPHFPYAGDHGTSAFFWLLLSDKGNLLLKMILTRHDQLINHIQREWLSFPALFDTSGACISSLFYLTNSPLAQENFLFLLKKIRLWPIFQQRYYVLRRLTAGQIASLVYLIYYKRETTPITRLPKKYCVYYYLVPINKAFTHKTEWTSLKNWLHLQMVKNY